jgi:hypothetical protein
MSRTKSAEQHAAEPLARHHVLHLLGRPDFRRLMAVRLFGQMSDGIFQASLAGAVLFNPERQTRAGDIAAGFVVLLLPYSILSPFAGVLLDRWWRQKVLMGANVLRALFVLGIATEISFGVHGQPFYLSALAVISVNRFVLSGLSASLPHVVEPKLLITASAVSTTAGAVATATGGGAAIGVRALLGSDNSGSALVAIGATLGYLAAAAFAHGFPLTYLGPDDDTRTHGQTVAHVMSGLAAGARHVRTHPTVMRAFIVIGAHRFAYGISAICTLLLYRNYFQAEGAFRTGLPGLAQLIGAISIGGATAAFVTPIMVRRFGFVRWPAGMLIAAGVVEWSLGLPFKLQTFVPAAAMLGFVAQGTKICVDTLVAQRVADDFRGRVFSLYDTLFNVVFVAAAVFTAMLLPENGKSVVSVLAIGAAYLLTGIGYAMTTDTEADMWAGRAHALENAPAPHPI